MKLYLDSADIGEIRQACAWGVISGVTTNPSLLAKAGGNVSTVIREICALVDGPVSVECVSEDAGDIVSEAHRLARLAPEGKGNVVCKVPLMPVGLAAVRQLSAEGISTNVTLVFSANQALLAGNAGATYVSPFVGRLDDIGHDGLDLVRDIAELYATGDIGTKIIAASIRHSVHVTAAAMAGAHIATIPFAVLKSLYRHPLTDAGIEKFMADWEKLTGGRGPIV